jgi:hypothetical protein
MLITVTEGTHMGPGRGGRDPILGDAHSPSGRASDPGLCLELLALLLSAGIASAAARKPPHP